MHIAFKFTYKNNNGLLIRLFRHISSLAKIPVSYYKDENDFILESSGNQEELEQLAQLVSSKVPQSLFLSDSTLQEISELSEIKEIPQSTQAYEIPYCPECEEKVLKTLDPFNECSVCGFSEKKISFEDLQSFSQTKNLSTPQEYFTSLADKLIEQKEIELLTFNGKRRFSLLSQNESDESSILVCDPSCISKDFSITQGELNALMLVEKPSVKLKPKLMFYHENALKKPMYKVFFADDKISLAFSKALLSKGIKFVYCENSPSLRVASSLGEYFIIKSGRDMLPLSYEMSNEQTLCCSVDEYRACIDKEKLIVDKKADLLKKSDIEFVLENTQVPIQTSPQISIPFVPSHATLRSIVLENNLEKLSLCNIYLSKEKSSNICSYSSKIGYIPMVDFVEESLSTPRKIIEEISAMDDEGKRLIENFKKLYPELYENLLVLEPIKQENSSMITSLWAMAAYFIGLCRAENISMACEYLESNALEFQGKSGPRIDYKVIKTETGYMLDPRVAIRSAISFKLAGVDNYLLSFGFVDSLADFLADQAELSDGNISIEGVCLSGSLFENHQLLMRTYNAISPNYKIFRNKSLSMDGENIAVGALTLGSE